MGLGFRVQGLGGTAMVYGPVTRRCLSKVGPEKLDVRTE